MYIKMYCIFLSHITIHSEVHSMQVLHCYRP